MPIQSGRIIASHLFHGFANEIQPPRQKPKPGSPNSRRPTPPTPPRVQSKPSPAPSHSQTRSTTLPFPPYTPPRRPIRQYQTSPSAPLLHLDNSLPHTALHLAIHLPPTRHHPLRLTIQPQDLPARTLHRQLGRLVFCPHVHWHPRRHRPLLRPWSATATATA